MKPAMVGQTLAHYKVLEKLGSGGMGDVYVAEDTKLGRKVALKVLPPEMATDERLSRFEREAKAVAALNHPNIVTVYSVEHVDGVHFITMELVLGKTLSELIPKKGFPLNRFFELAIPLADAVSAAHQHGVVHRDLKPDNLMQDQEQRLKILDFGLAKWHQASSPLEGGMSELPTQDATGEGRILGTVAYMSPEQAEGKSIDHRSDIFSMGIILHELATGQRPFQGDTPTSTLSAIIKDTPPSATTVNPRLPTLLGRVIRRCLAKDPERRYQSAKDLRNELEELKQDVDSGEALVGTSAPSISPVRWKPLWVAGAVVGLVAAAWVGGILPGRDGEPPVPPVPRLTNPVQVTFAVGVENFPSWSPDGETITFHDGTSHIGQTDESHIGVARRGRGTYRRSPQGVVGSAS